MKLTAAAIAVVLLQAVPTLAGTLSQNRLDNSATVEVVKSTDPDRDRNVRPSLSASEIAAIQYHEPLSFRCQTRAGVFAVSPLRPVDTACVVDGLPGFMLP